MRVITANVNGIRAAEKKGFFHWLQKQHADVVCIQETKAQENQLAPEDFYPAGKKGYSGVAIYARQEPNKITLGLGEGFEDMDAEGRFIQADFTRDDGSKLSVISLYLPSGSSKEGRSWNRPYVWSRGAACRTPRLQT